jgi:hypothetical protein
MTRHSSVQAPRRILVYEYVQTVGGRADQTYLLVFLLEGRYDGYLWFSSAQILKPEAAQ